VLKKKQQLKVAGKKNKMWERFDSVNHHLEYCFFNCNIVCSKFLYGPYFRLMWDCISSKRTCRVLWFNFLFCYIIIVVSKDISLRICCFWQTSFCQECAQYSVGRLCASWSSRLAVHSLIMLIGAVTFWFLAATAWYTECYKFFWYWASNAP
jgi:hypothetical protein